MSLKGLVDDRWDRNPSDFRHALTIRIHSDDWGSLLVYLNDAVAWVNEHGPAAKYEHAGEALVEIEAAVRE